MKVKKLYQCINLKRKFRRWSNSNKILLLFLFLLTVLKYYWQSDEEINTVPTHQRGNHPNDTVQIFPTLNLSDFAWTNSKDYFWNSFFEDRYRMTMKKFPLKIIVIPHSHNDPGWGWTYEQYFQDKTKDILNLAVDKLTEYSNMTFQWSEASFMDIWWLSATEQRKTRLKKLVKEKRFQIVTGGWVMTDEAIVPLYSMIDQLIEGQHWFKYHLDVTPQVSWSVDPFGLGSTLPYLLKISGIDSMVILRIHYAWKKWMAENQYGDFSWVQRWDKSNRYDVLCHQVFYTMYLIANSLGPHSEICRTLDFASDSKNVLTPQNIEKMATNFVEEAGRTASLYEHNVALPILGADFAYRYPRDWDQTYNSYMKLFDYINSKKEVFNAEASFGTLADYFKVIRERQGKFPSLTGDFFPYSDTESKPTKRTAYWSGFYSSRPFWKKLHREAEHNVRTAEILFAIANILESKNPETNILALSYPLLVKARQYLGLFAHHDASPGVSTAIVMKDYQSKLNTAIENSFTVQLNSFHRILSHLKLNSLKLAPWHKLSDSVGQYKEWKNKIFDLEENEVHQIVIFNSLGWEREEYVKLTVNTPYVGVVDADGNNIKSQLNPIIQYSPFENKLKINDSVYELVFMAKVPGLSLPTIFKIKKLTNDSHHVASKSKIVSNTLITNGMFEISKWSDNNGLHILENEHITLGFCTTTGFLKVIKNSEGSTHVNMSFGGYVSVPNHSGPYLFMASKEKITVPFTRAQRPDPGPDIVAINGIVSSEVIVGHDPIHLSVRILKDSKENGDLLFIENRFDSKAKEGEFFMKFDTSIQSTCTGENGNSAVVFYTDQSGYTLEKRIKVDSIGVEGNYYPVTTMASIQDSKTGQRLSVLVDRSHGAASLSSGSLELMIERRLLYDDQRGIGQGIMDNQLTTSNYILKLGRINLRNPSTSEHLKNTIVPTLKEHHQSQSLIYPFSIFVVTSSEIIDHTKVKSLKLFNKDLPKDTKFLNFRTLPKFHTADEVTKVNSSKIFSASYSTNALMILHKLDFMGDKNEDSARRDRLDRTRLFESGTKFNSDISPKSIKRTDLSGLRGYSSIFSDQNENFSNMDDIYSTANEISSFVLTF